MYNAQKYGYTFEIFKGYKFERGVIFKKYVEILYNLRQQYDKTNPLNLISKILLNSLYGRFGMKEIIIKYEICLQKDFYKITNKENIFDIIELGDHILFGLNIEAVEDNSNISVGVAAAITAYARIHMSQFKNNPNIKLYYTDTDSIFTDSELDQFFIDDKVLGKLKLEYFCKEAVFLGPKTYCLKTNKGLITKVKGLKNTDNLTLQDFKDLLKKDFYKIESHKK
jgi:DNA polymerase type B, organellar and viral